MTNGGSNDSRSSRNERREAARVKARQLRVEQKKRDRRNRVLVQGGIGVAILAALAIVAIVIVNSIRPPGPGPANMASDGIVIGTGLKAVSTASLAADAAPVPSTPDPSGSVVSIRLYVDYLCPFCGQFERTNASQLSQMASSGAATVEIHPISILTSHSAGTKYSLRAANAAACVADDSPNQFYKFHTSLFTNQPVEGSAGLTDAQIKKLVTAAGATNTSAINKCIDDGTYTTWVTNATDRAIAGPIPNSNVAKLNGTPLVLVNGKQYTGSLTSATDFKAFVLQAQGEAYSTATPVPTSTPTPTTTP
jgi:protein-disulfide isomerase